MKTKTSQNSSKIVEFCFSRRFRSFSSRKEEIQALSGPNEFTEFYSRLKNIRQYYTKNPSEEVRRKFFVEISKDFSFFFSSDGHSNVNRI